jgi:hypothetical protein
MPVNSEYESKGNFRFTEGQLHKVVFDVVLPGEPQESAAEFSDIE